MKQSILLLCLLMPLLLSAQNYTGTYYGDINGVSSTLSIDQSGNQISGKIVADNYPYFIQGTINSNQFTGTFTDGKTAASFPCIATFTESNVHLFLKYTDPNTGSKQDVPFDFSSEKPDNVNNVVNGTPPQNLDYNLIGIWTYSDSYSSGSYSFASQLTMILKQDGTYLYGNGKVAGGGDNISGSSEGGDWSRGNWKTENSHIYTNEGNGWQLYARYYIENGKMLLTFSDESKQIWYRN
jgi:hypothetical protein